MMYAAVYRCAQSPFLGSRVGVGTNASYLNLELPKSISQALLLYFTKMHARPNLYEVEADHEARFLHHNG
jgi:hypothetical protein